MLTSGTEEQINKQTFTNLPRQSMCVYNGVLYLFKLAQTVCVWIPAPHNGEMIVESLQQMILGKVDTDIKICVYHIQNLMHNL